MSFLAWKAISNTRTTEGSGERIMLWKDKDVLVTGAGGFIGSHLVAALRWRGAKVRALTHYNSRSDIGNLGFLTQEEMAGVTVIAGDIQDAGCVDEALQGCDVVFHLAALIGIPYSYVAPRSYVATNIGGTLNVLEAARRRGTSRVIHTSTSEVYGTAIYEPIDENHPLQGQSPYSASKIGADKLAESYHKSFGLPVVTVRPFNTYGPRQSARAVIPAIISQLLAGKETVELGALSPMRDLTYVEDTARGFIALAECDAAIGEVVNLGNGKTISIGDLANILVKMINPKAQIISKTERIRPDKSEVMKLNCNNEKATRLTDWKPLVSLRDGLSHVMKFISEHLEMFEVNRYGI